MQAYAVNAMLHLSVFDLIGMDFRVLTCGMLAAVDLIGGMNHGTAQNYTKQAVSLVLKDADPNSLDDQKTAIHTLAKRSQSFRTLLAKAKKGVDSKFTIYLQFTKLIKPQKTYWQMLKSYGRRCPPWPRTAAHGRRPEKFCKL